MDKLVLFPMIFFIFVYFFYVVLHKFLELKEDRKINKQLNPLLLLNERKNKIILDLANIDINKSRSEFYCNLNGIFRDYFDLINIKGIDNSTLKEIKKLDIDIDLLAIFEQSYLNEFCDVTDRELDIKQRKQIIYKFISYIK
ncbi:hypothetical protein HOG21_05935 [bacterium]|nr:hypothetical protein [bacterium]